MYVLSCLESTGSELWLGGGAIRNLVWDKAHLMNTLPKDYDIIHYNEDNSLEFDMAIYHKLKALAPKVEWQVVNQLRKQPVTNMVDGIKTWLDIASCVVVRKIGDEIEVIAPYGLDILFNLKLVPNCKLDKYLDLIQKKNWMQTYPRLQLIKIN